MCLDTINPTKTRKRTGWKIVNKTQDGESVTYTTGLYPEIPVVSLPLGNYVYDQQTQRLRTPGAEGYPTGFHIYLTEGVAQQMLEYLPLSYVDLAIVKVKFKEVVTCGTQIWRHRNKRTKVEKVIVAKAVMVVEEVK